MKLNLPSFRLFLGCCFVLILGVLGVNQVEDTSLDELVTRKIIYEVNVDEIIDENMEDLQNGLLEMDPMDLKEIIHPLSTHIYMKLHSGWLQNLSLLKRSGKCFLKYTNRVLTLDFNFAWDELAFDYGYIMKVLLVSRTGDLHGQLSNVKINIAVDLDLESYQVKLKRLNFLQAGKVTIALEGHMLDKIYNLMIKTATWLCKGLVLDTIEKATIKMIQIYINEWNEVSPVKFRQFLYAESIINIK